MQIQKKILEHSILELIIEENEKEMLKYRKQVFNYLEKNTNIKGFRKGVKIPENVLIRNHGEEYINNMIINFAIDKLYKEVLEKEKIFPVSEGEIKEVISEFPLKFKAHIEVFPGVEIDKKYKKIKLKKIDTPLHESEVEEVLEKTREKFTEFEKINDKLYKTALGDKLTIDADGYEKDKLLESISLRDFTIILGSKLLFPGFENGLVGNKLGDKLELDIDFPKNYHNKEFSNKKIRFKVNIKKIEKINKKEFTPDFIEKISGKKLDLDGFKELIKEQIKISKIEDSRIQKKNKLIDELIKISEIDLGEKIIKTRIESMYSSMKNRLVENGEKIDNYLKNFKLSKEEFKEKELKNIAIKNIKSELILDKLLELEKVQATKEEIQEEINYMKKKHSSPEELKNIKEIYAPETREYEGLKIEIIYRKIIDSFFF